MIARFFCRAGDESGVAMVETALWLPLIALVGLTGLEYTNWILAQQKVERISAVTADTIARNTIAPSERTFHDTFKAVGQLDAPFDVVGHGRTIITGVIGVNSGTAVVNKVVWQRCGGQMGTITSRIGSEWTATADYGQGPDVTLPNNIVLLQNQMAIVSEVGYQYQPMIDTVALGQRNRNQVIRQRTMFVTRGQAIPNITPTAGLTAARCS